MFQLREQINSKNEQIHEMMEERYFDKHGYALGLMSIKLR
jgi:hypothetical protein